MATWTARANRWPAFRAARRNSTIIVFTLLMPALVLAAVAEEADEACVPEAAADPASEVLKKATVFAKDREHSMLQIDQKKGRADPEMRVDPTNVGATPIDRAGYKEDWAKEWKPGNETPSAPPTTTTTTTEKSQTRTSRASAVVATLIGFGFMQTGMRSSVLIGL
mmetsp:Transcript_72290/g.154738  ORF Transcript_72290/g.154738 Transcript_72290/m.154738 type:complete len:166 (+) Transcript_72290:74-571(+)